MSAALLYEKLRLIHTSTFNVFNGNSDAHAQVEQYLRWVGESEQHLRPVMALEDLDRVLLTRRYWATHANPSYSPANVHAVQEEVRTRQQVFDDLVKAVDQERRRWASAEPEAAYVVADTNVHLHHLRMGGHRLALSGGVAQQVDVCRSACAADARGG